MVNKAPKPAKAPKANKRSKAGGPSNADLPFQKNYFSEESLFGRSQKFVQENDARPFRDFGYFVAFILSILIWRYQAALADSRESKLPFQDHGPTQTKREQGPFFQSSCFIPFMLLNERE